MANSSFIKGLFPIKPTGGTVKINYYKANTQQAIYLHDPVVLESAGLVVVAKCGSANAILGSAEIFLDSNLGGPADVTGKCYLPASTDGYVGVADDPQQRFLIEEDTGGTALTQSAVGSCADFTYIATTGDTTTGLSTVVLDRSGIDATSGQFQLLGILYADDNAFGDYCKWIVRINKHQLGTLISGIQAGV